MNRIAFIFLSLFLPLANVAAQEVAQDSFDCGEQVRIEATPLQGYRFVQWSDGDTSRVRIIEVNESVNLQAVFEWDCHDVVLPVVLVTDWLASVDRRQLIEDGLISETMPEDSVKWYKHNEQGPDCLVDSGFVLQISSSADMKDYYVEIEISEAVAKAHYICNRVLRGYPGAPTGLPDHSAPQPPSALKYFENGYIYIQREQQTYTIFGLPLAPSAHGERL